MLTENSVIIGCLAESQNEQYFQVKARPFELVQYNQISHIAMEFS